MNETPGPPTPDAGPLPYATPAGEPPRRGMLVAVAVAAVLVAVGQVPLLARLAGLLLDPSDGRLVAGFAVATEIFRTAGVILQTTAGLAAGVAAGLSVQSSRPVRRLSALLYALAVGALLLNLCWLADAPTMVFGMIDSVAWGLSIAAMWVALALACRRPKPG